MNRILIFILFASQITFGQSKIQHEPERLFNKLDLGKSTAEFIKEHKIEKIKFLRDTLLSSSIEFDRNGNSVCEIGMENNSVRKSLRKYDNQNREIETKYFSSDDSFRYGYYYEFKDGVRIMYKLKDSLLFRKTAFIKPENIRLYSEYDEDGNLKLKNIYTHDNDMKYLLETRFQNNHLYVQYRYEYLDNKKYVTKIQYDDNGTKVSEKRHLDEEEFPSKNKLNHYRDENESIFRVDSFDKNENLVKMELFDSDNKLYRFEINNYNSKGQLIKVIKENLKREIKTEYIYNYDNQNRIERIDKTTNGIKEIFRYEYKTF
ncbi:hypothetical protein FNB79_12085 [Formosa sediminum]|uniref:Sugar-binding protein n=1 Tax=Formosa sediminum TaxID=2594004 RepID=A0A516GT16_9FLAO|nr:hypothetical protein [Formosa sediminum]QDO94666.1 hypothetical protein FNB79_12085 [Formosa sediminum]